MSIVQDAGGSATVLASKKTGIDLAPSQGPPFIADLRLGATTLVILDDTTLLINGARVGYGVTVRNPTAAPLDGMGFQSWIVQGETTEKAAGGFMISCAPDHLNGVMPPGDCTVRFTVGAADTTGPGILQPGDATFVLVLSRSAGTEQIEMARAEVAITLVAGT